MSPVIARTQASRLRLAEADAALLRAACCAVLVEARLVLLALREEVDGLGHGESG